MPANIIFGRPYGGGQGFSLQPSPPQENINLFVGDTQSDAETARDAYFTANPNILNQYDNNNFRLIQVEWGTTTPLRFEFQSRAGGEWVNTFGQTIEDIELSSHSVTDLGDVTSAGSGQIITEAERNKLGTIEEGAEVNVQADWTETDPNADAFIQNKPENLVQDENYVHTDNNYTSAEKTKLSSIAAGAEVNVQSDWTEETVGSDAFIQNKPENLVQDANYVHTDNNYTTPEKTKLTGIETGAEINVQADWNQNTTTDDSFIQNKPENLVQDANYVHTDNNYTTPEKTKLAGIETGAGANVQSDWNETNQSSAAFIQNKPDVQETFTAAEKSKLTGIETGAEVNIQSDWNITNPALDSYIQNKPDVQETFTLAEKTKLAGIEIGAEVNIQSNWNETDTNSDAFIQNKPDVQEPFTSAEKTKLAGIASGAEVNVQSDTNVEDETLDSYIQNFDDYRNLLENERHLGEPRFARWVGAQDPVVGDIIQIFESAPSITEANFWEADVLRKPAGMVKFFNSAFPFLTYETATFADITLETDEATTPGLPLVVSYDVGIKWYSSIQPPSAKSFRVGTILSLNSGQSVNAFIDFQNAQLLEPSKVDTVYLNGKGFSLSETDGSSRNYPLSTLDDAFTALSALRANAFKQIIVDEQATFPFLNNDETGGYNVENAAFIGQASLLSGLSSRSNRIKVIAYGIFLLESTTRFEIGEGMDIVLDIFSGLSTLPPTITFQSTPSIHNFKLKILAVSTDAFINFSGLTAMTSNGHGRIEIDSYVEDIPTALNTLPDVPLQIFGWIGNTEIFSSPNGTVYGITIGNDGARTATAYNSPP